MYYKYDFVGSPMATIKSGSISCNSGISVDTPDKSTRVCDSDGSLSTTLVSGDEYVFSKHKKYIET